jgi:hypothetical protein
LPERLALTIKAFLFCDIQLMGLPIQLRAIQPFRGNPMSKQEKAKTAPILLTETETNHVAGGNNGNHYGQIEHPAWPINGGKAVDAPGHNK